MVSLEEIGEEIVEGSLGFGGHVKVKVGIDGHWLVMVGVVGHFVAVEEEGGFGEEEEEEEEGVVGYLVVVGQYVGVG